MYTYFSIILVALINYVLLIQKSNYFKKNDYIKKREVNKKKIDILLFKVYTNIQKRVITAFF